MLADTLQFVPCLLTSGVDFLNEELLPESQASCKWVFMP